MAEIVLAITWIGQACFMIEAGGTTILIDPDGNPVDLFAPLGLVESTG